MGQSGYLLLCLSSDNVQCVSIAKNDEETTVENENARITITKVEIADKKHQVLVYLVYDTK